MPIEASEPVTGLLLGWAGGDRNCLDSLILLLNAELRHIAHRYMRLERDGHTVQTTALINEQYLRLLNETEIRSGHRAQFLALAAQNNAPHPGGPCPWCMPGKTRQWH